MTLVAFFKGLFSIAEAVPILRDGFLAALSEYYQIKIDKAKEARTQGAKELENAKTPDEIQKALSNIVRGRAV